MCVSSERLVCTQSCQLGGRQRNADTAELPYSRVLWLPFPVHNSIVFCFFGFFFVFFLNKSWLLSLLHFPHRRNDERNMGWCLSCVTCCCDKNALTKGSLSWTTAGGCGLSYQQCQGGGNLKHHPTHSQEQRINVCMPVLTSICPLLSTSGSPLQKWHCSHQCNDNSKQTCTKANSSRQFLNETLPPRHCRLSG